MSQHVALPCVFTNKACRSMPLDVIQPPAASLQTALRSVKLDPPQVNGVRFKADMILSVCIGEALNGQEGNQHIVTVNAESPSLFGKGRW